MGSKISGDVFNSFDLDILKNWCISDNIQKRYGQKNTGGVSN